MKRLILALCFFISTVTGMSQNTRVHLDREKIKTIFSNQCNSLDLSNIWTATDSYFIIGYISDSFERVQIHYISVKKDPFIRNQYNLTGKIKIKEVVNSFYGHINISNIDTPDIIGYDIYDGLDRDTIQFANYQGSYRFEIGDGQNYSGKLEGECGGQFYIDAFYRIQYDDIIEWEHYSNNNFRGKWISADEKHEVVCNWGDYRVPQDSLFDWGVGHFVPNEKYAKNGWADYMKVDNDTEEYKKYLADKKRSKWWE